MDSRGAEREASLSARTHLPRTGRVSRIYRLVLAAIIVWFAVEWVTYGISGFSRPHTLQNPWFWIMTVAAVYYGLYETARGGFDQRWGIRTVGTFGVTLVAAVVAAIAIHDAVWAAPVTWLMYALNVGFLILAAIAFVVSAWLGTPGCEFGGLGELIRRVRGVSDPADGEALWCPVGLHRIDEWETTRQPWLVKR